MKPGVPRQLGAGLASRVRQQARLSAGPHMRARLRGCPAWRLPSAACAARLARGRQEAHGQDARRSSQMVTTEATTRGHHSPGAAASCMRERGDMQTSKGLRYGVSRSAARAPRARGRARARPAARAPAPSGARAPLPPRPPARGPSARRPAAARGAFACRRRVASRMDIRPSRSWLVCSQAGLLKGRT